MDTKTSFFDQPGTNPVYPGLRQGLQDDTRFTTYLAAAIGWVGKDRKAGSWFKNQVEPYKKKLREPRKDD